MTEEQFRDMYLLHGARVWAYVLRRTSGADDAADVVSDTFLTAWRRRSEWPSDEVLLPWLFGVARRVLANHDRSRRRRTRLDERVRATLEPVFRETGTDGALRVDVARALERLGEEDRELLRLSVWEQLTPAEIAITLDIPRATARTRLHRARRRARTELADENIHLVAAPCDKSLDLTATRRTT